MEVIDVEYCLNHITLLVDTREQPTRQSEERYASTGFDFRRKKLNVGDYSAEVSCSDGSTISFESRFTIERKMSLEELAQCFCKGRERFKREFERALANNTKVYLLVENGSIDNIVHQFYRTRMNPNAYIGTLFSFLANYNIIPIFCSSTSSGKIIRQIIKKEVERALYELE